LLNRARETAGIMRWREVPIVGNIAAGLPLYAQQEWGGSVVVDAAIYRGSNLFALRVTGDSMKDAAILDGDLVICEPRQFAENGEIVVALIHQEEATVKRFFLRKKQIELRPEHSAYRSVYYNFDQILVQGKVIGIQRGPDVVERL
jgi:repressor LexA